MPLYEYQCECGNEREILLPYNADSPRICRCGRTMQHKITLPSFVMKQTGNQMALDSLNSKSGGFPDANKRKSWAQQEAFEGTQSKAKAVW